MVRLGFWEKMLLMIPVALGILAGVSTSIYLLLFALLLLLLIITLTSDLRYHEHPFLYSLSFFTCLPYNIRISAVYCEIISGSAFWGLQIVSLVILMAVALVSIEEIILGLIGYILWGPYEKE